MTATPHNGHEDDFQLFLALLDGDRFEGRYREGVHTADPSDLMRRLIKEDLYTFDGRRLFPERRSHTVSYQQRRINVGFALMTLQRRLASSPEAIFRSIERRRAKLEGRLRDERIQLRGKRPRLRRCCLGGRRRRGSVEQVDNADATQALAERAGDQLVHVVEGQFSETSELLDGAARVRLDGARPRLRALLDPRERTARLRPSGASRGSWASTKSTCAMRASSDAALGELARFVAS